jgi:alpha-glucosidase
LSGFGLAGDDIGGFAGAGPGPELLTRWLEVGAFNPIFRDHAAKGKPPQEPWAGGDAQESIRRRYIEERYRLLPYLYALAEEQSRTGLPMLRPVFLEYPAVLGKGDHLGGTDDEFMLGPDLLIAPAPQGESPDPYTISLPGVGWYDYWSGLPVAAATLSETPQLERLPVLVRPGAIIARQPLVQSTGQVPVGPLELAVYPGPDCRGELYTDDGVSVAYRGGLYLRQSVRCHEVKASRAWEVEFDARRGRYPPWWHEIDIVMHGVERPPGVARLGRQPIAAHYDPSEHTLRLRIPDQRGPSRVVIEAGT